MQYLIFIQLSIVRYCSNHLISANNNFDVLSELLATTEHSEKCSRRAVNDSLQLFIRPTMLAPQRRINQLRSPRR